MESLYNMENTENTLFDTFGPVVSSVCFWSTKDIINIVEDYPMNIYTMLGSNGPGVFK